MMRLVRVMPMVLSAIWASLALAADPSPQVEVAEELEALMTRYGFEVRGIEQTVDTKARAEGEALLPRLRLLLEGFDHVILQTPEGGVERVIILGSKVPYVPPPLVVESDDGGNSEPGRDGAGEIVLPTQRQGASHSVTITLEGGREQRLQQVLLVDTGANLIVLPASLITPLSIAPESLKEQKVQTANGVVDARTGTLPAVWLGERRVADVQAAFIEDDKLGGNALLGMSLLGRFRMTIDDEKNQLTLATKEPVPK